jgi:polyisoprenoid-binding protein YceI
MVRSSRWWACWRQVGIIQVNARDLTTDNEFRNRAIKNRILQTDQYEFVTFAPTKIVGLPQTATIGEPYTFQIVGDLTIGEVTKQVTFDVTASASTETRLQGTATTTIAYADYGISIPQVPQVASVADQVRLELDFVAAAK